MIKVLRSLNNHLSYLLQTLACIAYLINVPVFSHSSPEVLKVEKRTLNNGQHEVIIDYPNQHVQLTLPAGLYRMCSAYDGIKFYSMAEGKLSKAYAFRILDKSQCQLTEEEAKNFFKDLPKYCGYTHFKSTSNYYIWMVATNTDKKTARAYFESLGADQEEGNEKDI